MFYVKLYWIGRFGDEGIHGDCENYCSLTDLAVNYLRINLVCFQQIVMLSWLHLYKSNQIMHWLWNMYIDTYCSVEFSSSNCTMSKVMRELNELFLLHKPKLKFGSSVFYRQSWYYSQSEKQTLCYVGFLIIDSRCQDVPCEVLDALHFM